MTRFEFTISVPADVRFADCLRALASEAARQAGCEASAAETFGAQVLDAIQPCLAAAGPGAIPIVIRQVGAELEVLIECGPTIRVARPVPNVV